MVRVRSIFATILCVLKNDNKKARSLDKVPKLRAFLPFQLLLIIGLLVAGAVKLSYVQLYISVKKRREKKKQLCVEIKRKGAATQQNF